MSRSGIAAALLVLLPLAGCGLFGSDPGPEDVANDFLTAFGKGDTAGAADRTDAKDSAKALLDNVRGALKPTGAWSQVTGSTSMQDKSVKVRFTADWDLGRGRRWNYQGELEMRPDNDSWRVHWSPSVIHPKLGAQQTLGLRDQEPTQAPVLDRDDAPLISPERVVSVVLDPAKAGDVASVAGTLAAAVTKVDATITQQSIMDGVAKTPKGQSYTVVSLRDADYQAAKAQIYELPGVRFLAATRLLPVDKNLATQLLPSIRKVVENQVGGKPGFRVVSLNAAGGEVEEIFAKSAEAGTAAHVTLSRKVQAAAEAAIDTVTTPAAIVAIQPSSGDILAVAQNAPADVQGAIALTGRFPPGSTFKIVTSASALQAGTVTMDTPVPCPGTINIGPRAVPNVGNFDKGTIPLRLAFAYSCNTSFAKLAAEMAPDALPNAARQLGIGVDYVIPGVTTVTGSIPPASDLTERAEDGFGQGKVLASPFGLAVVASTVASGTVPKATLLRDNPTKVNQMPPPVGDQVLVALRQMMREVVTVNHPGHPIAQLTDVRGKTGTAQFGDGTHSHGWFAGYQGDLAFAVLLTDAGASGPAVDAADRFLRGIG